MNPSSQNSLRQLRRSVLLALAVGATISAPAASITFDGGGTGGTVVSTATNWAGDVLPTSTDEALFTDAGFGGALPASLTNGVDPLTWGSLNWNSASSATISGSRIFLNGAGGNFITLGSNMTSGTLTISAGPNALYRSATTGGTLNVVNAGATLVISSQANLPAGQTITKTGAGTIRFSNGNNAGAGTFVLDGGTVDFVNAAGFGGGTTSTLEIHNGTFLDNTTGAGITLSRNFRQTWTGDFTFKGTGQSLNMGTGAVILSGGTRQVTVSARTLTQGGSIGDEGNGYGLTKAGAGTLTLTAINTYSGTTTVLAGTLLLSGTGSIASSAAVSVASGATLNVGGVTGGFSIAAGQILLGSGTVTGSVATAGVTSVIAPGNSPGMLTLTGGLNATNGANFVFELGTTSDVLNLGAGILTGSSGANGLVFDFSNSGGLLADTTYTLITFGSSTGLEYPDLSANLLPSGFTLNTGFGTNGFLINGNSLQVQFSSVPEPSTAMLLGLGLAFSVMSSRRKRSVNVVSD